MHGVVLNGNVVHSARTVGGGAGSRVPATEQRPPHMNSAYIGARNQHPYGGTWKTTPHCTGPVGCGWQ